MKRYSDNDSVSLSKRHKADSEGLFIPIQVTNIWPSTKPLSSQTFPRNIYSRSSSSNPTDEVRSRASPDSDATGSYTTAAERFSTTSRNPSSPTFSVTLSQSSPAVRASGHAATTTHGRASLEEPSSDNYPTVAGRYPQLAFKTLEGSLSANHNTFSQPRRSQVNTHVERENMSTTGVPLGSSGPRSSLQTSAEIPQLPEGDYVALGDINAELDGKPFSVIAVVTESQRPHKAKNGDGDLTMRLRLVDKSNLESCGGVSNSPNTGFKVNLFTRLEDGEYSLPAWARKGDVVILQNLKTTHWSSKITGVGYKEQLCWAIYDPETGRATQRPLGALKSSASDVPRNCLVGPEEPKYCAWLAEWWKSEMSKANGDERLKTSTIQNLGQKSLGPPPQPNTAQTDTVNIITIKELLKNTKQNRAIFNIKAHVIRHTSPPVENYVSKLCSHCQNRIPNTHKSCATCSNTQGAHVIHAYNLVFRLQDEIGDILDVEVNQNSEPLKGLPPIDLWEDATAVEELRRRLRSFMGDSLEVNFRNMTVARVRRRSDDGKWRYKLL